MLRTAAPPSEATPSSPVGTNLYDRNAGIVLAEILVARELRVVSEQALRRLIENIPVLPVHDAPKLALRGQTLERFSQSDTKLSTDACRAVTVNDFEDGGAAALRLGDPRNQPLFRTSDRWHIRFYVYFHDAFCHAGSWARVTPAVLAKSQYGRSGARPLRSTVHCLVAGAPATT